MISILALTVVGTWSYAGFLEEPNPTPAPVSAAPTLPTDSTLIPFVEPEPEDPPAAKPEPKVRAPVPPPSPSIPIPPSHYRSTDASGQTWEHPDPAYLSSFVNSRNQSFQAQFYTMPRSIRTSQCAGGRCN